MGRLPETAFEEVGLIRTDKLASIRRRRRTWKPARSKEQSAFVVPDPSGLED
jgi:hypothetical protein